MKRDGKGIPIINIKEHKTKMLAVVDEDTGLIEYFRPLREKKIAGSWVAMFQQGLAWIAKQNLTGEQWNVFAFLLSIVDFQNYIRISQKDIAEALGMKHQNVSRSIKKLEELDIIVEGPRAGLHKTYMLNPNIGLKGKQKGQKVVDFSAEKAKRQKEPTE